MKDPPDHVVAWLHLVRSTLSHSKLEHHDDALFGSCLGKTYSGYYSKVLFMCFVMITPKQYVLICSSYVMI